MDKQHHEERVDFLPGTKLGIIQRRDVFVFSTDAVLLSKFASIPKRGGRMIDLCAGNGAIPMMLTKRTDAPIDAVEIQEPLVDLALRNMKNNGLDKQVNVIHQDITKLHGDVAWGRYDVVTCNPPYFPMTVNERDRNENKTISLARHEITCTIDDVVRIASRLVKYRGKFALVHRPERLADIMSALRTYDLEPKRIQYVHGKRGKEANMVLIESMKSGSPGLKTLFPISVYGEDGQYLKEFKDHYESW
ncbi:MULTISPECIES: tRNA1(Val) (adenine(37)-N6)-methyltransferase [Alteribacter]|uniref:tRNA1(Val) (Adenine(37)-N6)-methyltransferase n=1 Tax=Alteribacter keqinensis TaxID=2483800 RepID=A0A3M7TKM8_9BACI|nr:MULTISPECIES: tRNA1(Val) (adenine(37)-N6)-methyltransferase [Alteribacter]MBM7098037.1 tRNA1(Val) (adenine(37)-N6)-methyltransferase [Alteribacter salitolerans]RNA66063.1 tRNA1(Val) (adenine(37)-N6)-methyltransferase [Alteribacter keqinensis]